MFFFLKMGQNKSLPVAVKSILAAAGLEQKSASGFTRFKNKMNFRIMPELEWVYTLPNGWDLPLGYIFAIGLMILASGLTMGYFRYKKWL